MMSPLELGDLIPLNRLSSPLLRQITDAARVENILPSTTLNASEEHRWLVYLLDGTLILNLSDGKNSILSSSDPSTNNPVFDRDPKPTSATPRRPSTVIRIDRNMLHVSLKQEETSSTIVQEFDVGEAGEKLFTRVYQAYVDRKLQLPSLPDVALRIREVIKDPDLGVSDISRVVQSDPTLTARLIQVANSPMYRGVEPAGSVLAAIIRLGAKATQNISFVMAISRLFKSDSVVIQSRITELYNFSRQVAATSFVIANRCPNLDRERAMLLGLVNYIGAIPILTYAGEDPSFVDNKTVISNILANLCSITSGLVLRQWGFDTELTLICENYDESRVIDVNQPISYYDVLQAAILITPENFLGGQAASVEFDDHPLQQKFAAAGVMGSRASFLEEAGDELAATNQLLKR